MTLTAKRLRELARYDRATGLFYWRVSRGGGVCAGDVMGCVDHRGYRVTTVDCKTYRTCRLVWLWMTGSFPLDGYEIDHRDTDRSNDAWSNLRLATRAQNARNASIRHDNKSGFKGVSRKRGKFQAYIDVDGQRRYLGNFSTATLAARAYNAAALRHHGEFAQLNRL